MTKPDAMKLYVPRRNQGMTIKQIPELSIVVVSRVKTHYSAVCRLPFGMKCKVYVCYRGRCGKWFCDCILGRHPTGMCSKDKCVVKWFTESILLGTSMVYNVRMSKQFLFDGQPVT